MTSYASLSDVKHYLGIDDTGSDAQLLSVLEAASRWIDNYTGRVFSVDAADTTRYFYPESDQTVSVPDLRTITSIATDEDGDRTYARVLATTDYELLPTDGPPYRSIRIWPQSSYAFVPGYLVKIVGKFGYLAVPAEVKQANLILASRYYRRAEAPFGILQSVDLGQFTRISTQDPDVIALLQPYRVAGGASWILV